MMSHKKYDFFISYRRANNGSVCGNYIAELLKDYSLFYDISTISEGRFEEQIKDAIRNTKRFILIVTEGAFRKSTVKQRIPFLSHKIDWYYREISLAIDIVGLDRITPIIFSGALTEEILPDSLRNRGLTTCQKVPYIPEYAEFFEQKLCNHLHIPFRPGLDTRSGLTIRAPTIDQINDDTENLLI